MASPFYLTLVTAFYLLSFLPTSPSGQNAGSGVYYDPEAPQPSTCSSSQLGRIEQPGCATRPTLVKLPFPVGEPNVDGINPQVI